MVGGALWLLCGVQKESNLVFQLKAFKLKHLKNSIDVMLRDDRVKTDETNERSVKEKKH